ncbi:MAG: hypothetical protein SWK76_05785 [Actinomycetota bacterium]|nr:hypothetical protein [Actinomycetota bacterium]
MEILALLLLGLIAMLAIVPPIIRGKLDESPLITTQDFQRSMHEIANSLEPGDNRSVAASHDHKGSGAGEESRGGRPRSYPAGARSRTNASVRRNRITAALAVFASIWGVATLISGSALCLVVFAVCCCLLAVYWALVLLVPRIIIISSAGTDEEEPSGQSGRYPKRHAM